MKAALGDKGFFEIIVKMETWQILIQEARWFIYLIAGVLGACYGSFMSVCIWRMPREESIVRPRSHCPSCNKLIPWYCNIPVLSWVFLGGKCAYCKSRISARYLLLELLTAALFVLTVWRFTDSPWMILVMWVVVFGLMLGTFIDIDWYILPDSVTIGGIVFGLIVSALLPAEMHGVATWQAGLLKSAVGLAFGFSLLYLVAVIGKFVYKKEAMGFGDVKLMGALGALFGASSIVFILFVSSLLGSVVGVTLMALKKRDLQGRIPYGPFIAAAALIWIFCGSSLRDWYLSILMIAP